MEQTHAQPGLLEAPAVRRWLNRAFIVSILVYLIVIGYLVAESVMGASRWAPYGVNVPAFMALVIASEVIVAGTAAWIFREDEGIWPPAIADGWTAFRSGARLRGLREMAAGAWDIPILDLRLRTPIAIALGRANRIAALAPLAYALIASANSAPWGLRGSALFDVAITLAVWGFMEAVMVKPERAAAKRSYYQTRPVRESDVERILEIERLKWSEQAATADQVLGRMRVFPEGQLAAVHVNETNGAVVGEKLVAWSTVTCTSDVQIAEFRSWNEITANGTIANCDPEGDVIIGVNLTSVAEGASYLLLGEILASVVAWNKAKAIGGSRLNGFIAFNSRRRSEGKRPFSAEEYATLREVRGYQLNEERRDQGLAALADDAYATAVARLRAERGEEPLPETTAPDYVCSNVRGYMGIPGAHFLRVIPDYFQDSASDDYGVLIEWPNPLPRPLRLLPFVRNWTANSIRRAVRKELDGRRTRLRKAAERRARERVPEYLRREEERRPGTPIEKPAPVIEGAVAVAPEGVIPREDAG
jgi:hypothetical protein